MTNIRKFGQASFGQSNITTVGHYFGFYQVMLVERKSGRPNLCCTTVNLEEARKTCKGKF